MKPIKKFLANHFRFTPVEIRGFFVLLLLMAFFTFLPWIWSALLPTKVYDRNSDQALLDSLLASMQTPEPETKKAKFAKKVNPKQERKLFPFDPNTASLDNLLALGIRNYLAERIIKYRSKGGKFYKKEDLLKIYGFKERTYRDLEPYIQIKTKAKTYTKTKKNFDKDGNDVIAKKAEETVSAEIVKPIKPQKLNINTADTTQLKSIYGVGSVLANRMVKFRDKLGGFYSLTQLEEVYGLKPETIEKILEKVEQPNQTDIQKIKVNHLDEKELQKHPYISWKEAKFIVKYRNQHGPYKSIEGLADIKVFDDAFIKKIAPYISYE